MTQQVELLRVWWLAVGQWELLKLWDNHFLSLIFGLPGAWCFQLKGNYVGMTEEEMEKCDPAVLAAKIENAKSILYKASTITT